jgi:hypothetical protein
MKNFLMRVMAEGGEEELNLLPLFQYEIQNVKEISIASSAAAEPRYR